MIGTNVKRVKSRSNLTLWGRPERHTSEWSWTDSFEKAAKPQGIQSGVFPDHRRQD